MGRKNTSFGVKYQNILVKRQLLNYKEMFAVTPIYIRYAVISVVLLTPILAIELFCPTKLFSFLGYFFDYLPLFIPYRFAVYP